MTTTGAERRKLRVVILTGLESGSVLDAISAVAASGRFSGRNLVDSIGPRIGGGCRIFGENIRQERNSYIDSNCRSDSGAA